MVRNGAEGVMIQTVLVSGTSCQDILQFHQLPPTYVAAAPPAVCAVVRWVAAVPADVVEAQAGGVRPGTEK